ncbi:MAG TPA: SMP-30/gluconolactonase/LRE family protein [Abditibacteriaceae bacterium]|jgi:D-xylonolactonase
MSNKNITPLVNEHCATGENPFWNPNDGKLYWTDIPNGKIFRYDAATGTHELIYQGEQVGGFTLQADGNWLLFRVRDIATLSSDGEVSTLIPFQDEGMARFNDVIADPEGRVYAGTIGRTNESGGLYRVERDGSIHKLFEGTGCANGMAFTPDLQFFYWTCSTTKRIFRFRYNSENGELTDRTLFYQADDKEGTPDGLVVTSDGSVWSARYGGHAIIQHNAVDGHVTGKIEMPVRCITSLIFGGPQLDTLYVTTAEGKPGSDSADGTLYQVDVETKGQPEFLSRIHL